MGLVRCSGAETGFNAVSGRRQRRQEICVDFPRIWGIRALQLLGDNEGSLLYWLRSKADVKPWGS